MGLEAALVVMGQAIPQLTAGGWVTSQARDWAEATSILVSTVSERSDQDS